MAKRSSKRRRKEARVKARAAGEQQPPRSRGARPNLHHHRPAGPPAPLPENSHDFVLTGFEITWEPIPSPEIDRLPQRIKDHIPELHRRVKEDPAGLTDELRVLTARHPEVDCFRNWLCQCYRQIGQDAEARRIAEWSFSERPGYLFGRTTLAEILIESGDIESAERVLAPGQDLTTLYPDRERFHISEVRHYFFVTAKFHLVSGNTEAARSWRDLLNEIEPDSDIVEQLDWYLEEENAINLAMIGLFRDILRKAEARDYYWGQPVRRKRRVKDPTGKMLPAPESVTVTQGELFTLEELTA